MNSKDPLSRSSDRVAQASSPNPGLFGWCPALPGLVSDRLCFLGRSLALAFTRPPATRTWEAPPAPATMDLANETVMEDPMNDEHHRRNDPLQQILRLKNGAEIGAEEGRMLLECLRMLDAERLQSLLDLARGGTIDPTLLPPSLLSLSLTREPYSFYADPVFFEAPGKIKPSIKDVLLSAYQETPEGPVLVNPFKVANTFDIGNLAAVEKRHEEDAEASWQRMVNHLRREGLWEDPGR